MTDDERENLWNQLTARARRLVVKVGTSTLTAGGMALDGRRLDGLVRQVVTAHRAGLGLSLVTSGAIVTGAARLGLHPGRRSIVERQALAAVGQAILMHEYGRRFSEHAVMVAQILLTARDFDQRRAFVNARNTFEALLSRRVIPIVNENDTVATEEIKIGDNDTLSARVAALLSADLLIILSDTDGLYTADPHRTRGATRVEWVDQFSPGAEAFSRPSASPLGIGGMRTKLAAARIAARAGVAVAIVNGSVPDIVQRVLAGEPAGTRFLPREPLRGRKRWLALGGAVRGRVTIDAGAAEALLARGKSLLPSGIVEVQGSFSVGDLVAIVGPDGRELGRGVASYNCEELERIKGRRSMEARTILGTPIGEAVHRDNLILHG